MERKEELEVGPTNADSDETGKSGETQRPSGGRRFLSVLGWLWERASIVVSLGLLLAAFLFGLVIGRGDLEGTATKGSQDAALPGHDHGTQAGTQGGAAEKPVETWTCSMHPQIRQPKPGLCPICNMELVPVKSGGGGERSLVMTPEGKKLARISTAPVERKAVSAAIRLVGKVDYDETRVKEIAAWVPGRIDHLYADFMGKIVEAGQPLVELYSPDLYVAQKELLLARSTVGVDSGSTGPGGMADGRWSTRPSEPEGRSRMVAGATVPGEPASRGDGHVHFSGAGLAGIRPSIGVALLVAARDKLRLAGVTSEQIQEIEERGTAFDKQIITAPIGGTIVRKMVNEGAYVATGTPLLTVADLSVVWVRLQAYESDLPWLHAGQDVAVSTDAFPGVEMTGRIVFIDPYIDAASRTAGVRVEVPNPDGLLKPEMFARAEVRADLVDADGNVPLVVPATAVLLTGKRAVVYVEEPNTEEPTYTGRTVTVGTRAADWYVVQSGLSEGEQVVTNGAFRIDADLQIQAKPSMMSMPSEPLTEAVPAAFVQSLTPVYEAYFKAWKALASDDKDGVVAGFKALHEALPNVSANGLAVARKEAWRKQSDAIMQAALSGASAANIASARTAFDKASMAILTVESTFGHSGPSTHYQMHCSMAFDNRGADWLQPDDQLLNPYFGSMMLRCGEQKKSFPPVEKR